jgi:C4-type Zn-finger protein
LVFICPACKYKTLEIISSIELPPDIRSDEITLQILKCKNCEFKSLGLYEESRRGALGYESVNHRGFYLPEKDLEDI